MSKKRTGKTEFVKWFGPVLDALKALGGSAKPKEITEWIGEKLNIPDTILTYIIHKPQPEYGNYHNINKIN